MTLNLRTSLKRIAIFCLLIVNGSMENSMESEKISTINNLEGSSIVQDIVKTISSYDHAPVIGIKFFPIRPKNFFLSTSSSKKSPSKSPNLNSKSINTAQSTSLIDKATIALVVPTTTPLHVSVDYFRPITTAPTTLTTTRHPSIRNPTKAPTTRPSSNLPSSSRTLTPKKPSKLPTLIPSKKPPTPSPSKLLPEYDIKYYPNITILTGIVTTYHIYVGDFTSSTTLKQTTELMEYFAANIGDSTWFPIITTYYQINSKTNKKTYASGKLKFGGSVRIKSDKKALTLTLNNLVTELLLLLNSFALPFDTNGIYTFFLRGDTTIDGWLTVWCGGHFSINVNTGVILNLSVILDTGSVQQGRNPSQCMAISSNTPNGNVGADNMASVYAHELVETISNYNGAWHFNRSAENENADACAWNFGEVNGNSNVQVGQKRFLLQQNWQPKVGCTLTKQLLN